MTEWAASTDASNGRRLPTPVVERLIGAAVVALAALIIAFVYRSSGIEAINGYTVTAKFDRIEGIRVGTDVRMSGIKIGAVLSQTLEPVTYRAVLLLGIDKSVKLPVDTAAKITTEGLVGSKYVELTAGAEDKLLRQGDQITQTQSSINLEDLINRYIPPSSKSQGKPKGRSGTKDGR